MLFDLDGTLIDTWHLYIESYRRTLEPILKRSISEDEIIKIKPTAERRILEKIVDAKYQTEAFNKFLKYYSSLHDYYFEGTYPGILKMLDELRKKNYLLGIVTGKSREAWNITQQKVELGPFEIVITDSDVINAKPDPEGINKALKYLNIPCENVIFIGDSFSDLEAADAAEVYFGAALWPKGEHEVEVFRQQVKKRGNHIILEKPQNLIK